MLKLISAIALSTGLLLCVGCTEKHVVKDNSVAAMFARSMPPGDVAQGNTVVKASANAVNMPLMQNVSTATTTAQNAVGATTPAGTAVGGIANTLSPTSIENAIQTALSNALSQHPSQGQSQKQPKGTNSAYYYGFPPFVVGTFNEPIMYGPGPAYFNVPKQ